MRPPVAFVVLLALAAPAGAQSVHVVGTHPGPGVEFTSVQAAVDASAPGDVVLLLPGDHLGPVTVDNSLVLLGAPAKDGAAPSLQELTIDAPSPFAKVAVRGIRLASTAPTSKQVRHALHVADSPGLFLFEDCVSADLPGQDAWLDWSGRAVFVRCAFRGDSGINAPLSSELFLPGPALLTVHTTQALYDCRFTGGTGAAAKQAPLVQAQGQAGAYGVIFGSAMYWDWTLAARLEIEGGNGGAGLTTSVGTCLGAGAGGTALHVSTLLRTAAVELVAGLPGIEPTGCPAAAAGGEVDVAPTGSILPLPVEPPSLDVTALLEPGHVAQLHYVGAPGQPVVLLVSGSPELLWLPGAASALGVSLDHSELLLGAADGAGLLDLSIPIPAGALDGRPPDAAMVLYLQAVTVAPTGWVLSNPVVVSILRLP